MSSKNGEYKKRLKWGAETGYYFYISLLATLLCWLATIWSNMYVYFELAENGFTNIFLEVSVWLVYNILMFGVTLYSSRATYRFFDKYKVTHMGIVVKHLFGKPHLYSWESIKKLDVIDVSVCRTNRKIIRCQLADHILRRKRYDGVPPILPLIDVYITDKKYFLIFTHTESEYTTMQKYYSSRT